jgi:dipeptidyl aminopeptidase/acylaminoacyl peptidase
VLVACGSEAQDDRRFANEPVTEQPPTATSEPASPVAPTATSAPLASPETLLATRGAPDTLYTVANTDLVALTLTADGPETKHITLPDGRPLLAFDASPNGDRVAVLVGPGEEADGVVLLLFDRAGKPVGEARTVLATAATPQAGAAPDAYNVTWSPQGNAMLVAGPSVLVNVPVSGEPQSIPVDGIAGRILAAAWSPQGTQIAVVVAHDDASQEVLLLGSDGRISDAPAPRAEPGKSIEHLHWLADGSGLVYVRANLANGVPFGGQLFTYRLRDAEATLVATSGQGGPSATITTIAPSPDGRSVAYVISIRDGDHWAFHSLWVRSFKQPLSYQVPVDAVAAAPELWWVDRGLAWEQVVTEDPASPSEIVFMNQAQEPRVLLETTPPASATPAASPVATPQATPAPTPTPAG